MKRNEYMRRLLLIGGMTACVLMVHGCSNRDGNDVPAFYQWLDVGLTFDRKLKNVGIVRIRTTDTGCRFVRDGVFGKACQFPGRASITLHDLRMPYAGTWAVWFRISPDADISKEMRILDANHYRFSLVDGKPLMLFHDGQWRRYTATESVAPGRWTHLAMTWGDETMAFFVNGEQVRSMSYSGTPSSRVRDAVIGARFSADSHWFTGDVDELLFYGRALDAAEIRELRASGVDKAKTPDMVYQR